MAIEKSDKDAEKNTKTAQDATENANNIKDTVQLKAEQIEEENKALGITH